MISVALAACTRAEAPAGAPAGTPDPPPSAADIGAFNGERQRLVEKNAFEDADRICRSWIERRNPVAQAEGHKCAANMFVRRAQDSGEALQVSSAAQRLAIGGTAAEPRFSGPAIVQAIDQLDLAAARNPADLSIHEGRLFLALGSGEYARAVSSLDSSLRGHPRAPASTWLAYVHRFPRARAAHAVSFARLLVAHYPQDASVHVALGAWLDVTGDEKEAKQQLQRALELEPKHAMALWRLGEVTEQFNDAEGARKRYLASVKLDGELAEERRSEYARRTGAELAAQAEATDDAAPDEE
jgi:Flp pilus assembly protein TadD